MKCLVLRFFPLPDCLVTVALIVLVKATGHLIKAPHDHEDFDDQLHVLSSMAKDDAFRQQVLDEAHKHNPLTAESSD
eukprot:m.70667 g.70667  ORF g.70667 m.70667 type:complete len:77 (+) comp12264_c0_seq11:2071-2301(+)